MWQRQGLERIDADQFLLVFADCGCARAGSDPPYAVFETTASIESARKRMLERACSNLAIGVFDSEHKLLYCMDHADGNSSHPGEIPEEASDLGASKSSSDLHWVFGGFLLILAFIWIIIRSN
ncbi:MAG: hypothetical protein ACI8W8_000971 [Rhodothermales bacterium]|jgi:hypothetical protein